MLGITLHGAPGLGDKLIFSSFPENYFRNTGELIIDLDQCWIFDHNPYVVRGRVADDIFDPWNEIPKSPKITKVPVALFNKRPIYSSVAERNSLVFGHVAYLRHPRLYRFEDIVARQTKQLVLHTTGISGGNIDRPTRYSLPPPIIDFIKARYHDWYIIQIGSRDDEDAGVHDRRGFKDIWDTVKLIAESSMFIGVDSGPSWIASCYPQVFCKKVLGHFDEQFLRDEFVPMHKLHPRFHWHDNFVYYNATPDDVGVTYSYLKL